MTEAKAREFIRKGHKRIDTQLRALGFIEAAVMPRRDGLTQVEYTLNHAGAFLEAVTVYYNPYGRCVDVNYRSWESCGLVEENEPDTGAEYQTYMDTWRAFSDNPEDY